MPSSQTTKQLGSRLKKHATKETAAQAKRERN